MIAPQCKVGPDRSVVQSMDQPKAARRTPATTPHHLPGSKAFVRHPTFLGRVIDRGDEELSIESDTGLRIGARYELELVAEMGTSAIEVVVRWCRLCSVIPGSVEGEFVTVFRSGLQIASPS